MTDIKNEEVATLYKDLDDFLESCIISRMSRNDPKLTKSLFSDSVSEKIDYFFIPGAAGTIESFAHWWNDYKHGNYWIGITGSWRTINQELIDDISETVRYILGHKFGILTGGALGVDYIATETVLREGDPKKQLRIVLPIKRHVYLQHLINSKSKSVINNSQLTAISNQLSYIRERFPNILFDEISFNNSEFLENEKYREDCYSLRNNLEAYACDGLIPFWVNGSNGVEDTIKIVESLKKPVFGSEIFKYNLDQDSEEAIRDYSELTIPNINSDYPKTKYFKKKSR